jgi:hypothetical protein
MATPVISPQAPMPMAVPTMSRAPRANSGWRQAGAAAAGSGGFTRELSPATVAALPRAARRRRAGRAYLRVTLPLPATDFLTTASPR